MPLTNMEGMFHNLGWSKKWDEEAEEFVWIDENGDSLGGFQIVERVCADHLRKLLKDAIKKKSQ